MDRPTRGEETPTPVYDLLPDDVNGYYGFAGPRFAWQNSKSRTEKEIFADQYTGWVYGEWELAQGSTTKLTDAGQVRSDFMDKYMAIWIETAINKP